uniref:Uncharacterized protein n=1 Tax=Oryza sativa subsp. japonica TaxID=39947 RepID=Q69SM6_ORYSJ|nr:hypothetical protein [Oryza sativa Japonica Group]
MATTVELDGDGADSGWRWSCAGISGSDGEVHGTEAGCGEPTGDGRRGRGWRRQDVDFMEVDHVVVLCGDLGQRRRGQPGLWWIGRRQVAIKVKGNKPRPTARLSLPDPLSKLARAAGGFGW